MPVNENTDPVTNTPETVTETLEIVNENPETVTLPATVDLEPQIISFSYDLQWNYTDARAALESIIERYIGLAVTDENLSDMEKAQKEIASFRVKLDKFRKEKKKQLSAPVDDFESKIKDLLSIVDKAESPLKDQILKYEDERRKTRETDWLEWAKTTAKNLKLRDSYFNITIKTQWTNRGAKDSVVRKEIVDEIEALLAQQTRDDEAAELKRQRFVLIEQLCDSNSKASDLSTPVNCIDVAKAVEHAGLAELSGIITEECRKRKEVELRAAAAAAPPPVTVMPVPDSDTRQEWPGAEVAPLELEYEEPPTEEEYYAPAPIPAPPPPPLPPIPPPQRQWEPPMPPPIAELWDVDLHVSGITVAQAEELKSYMTGKGIQYNFSGYTRRK